LLKRKPVSAIAEPDLDEKAVETRMFEYLKHVPQAARSFGIRIEKGDPNPEEVAHIVKDRLFVRIKPI
jgi:hypothetical protein